MFDVSRKLLPVVAVAIMATGTPGHAASTNPWAIPAQPYGNGLQGNMQGGFSFGGGAGFSARNNGTVGQAPSVVAPAPAPQVGVPASPAPARKYQAPNLNVPNSSATPFGQYPPLTDNNATSSLGRALPAPKETARPKYSQPYTGYGYGGVPQTGFGIPYYGGFNPFGFGTFNGGFNFGFNGFGNGFGSGWPGIFTAPGPLGPGYVMPNYGYGNQNSQGGVPLFRAPVPEAKAK